MRVFRHFDPFPSDARGGVFAIGNFDGVHLGHQKILANARDEAARRGVPFGVLTFEPHPRQFFNPHTLPFCLTPFRSKMHALQATDCNLAVCLHFDRDMASMPARDFVSLVLAGALNVSHIVVGYDFVFGQKRSGSAALLQEMSAEFGFGMTCHGPVLDAHGVVYSSTEIRNRLVAGDAKGAAAFLGRPWEIFGRVETGDRRGRTIGFPTANIVLGEYLRPAAGVYATEVGIEHPEGNIDWQRGVANIGARPTVGGTDFRLEVHLLDFTGNLYGKNLRVLLIDRIRAEQKFSSLNALKAQIVLDAAQAREILAKSVI